MFWPIFYFSLSNKLVYLFRQSFLQKQLFQSYGIENCFHLICICFCIALFSILFGLEKLKGNWQILECFRSRVFSTQKISFYKYEAQRKVYLNRLHSTVVLLVHILWHKTSEKIWKTINIPWKIPFSHCLAKRFSRSRPIFNFTFFSLSRGIYNMICHNGAVRPQYPLCVALLHTHNEIDTHTVCCDVVDVYVYMSIYMTKAIFCAHIESFLLHIWE